LRRDRGRSEIHRAARRSWHPRVFGRLRGRAKGQAAHPRVDLAAGRRARATRDESVRACEDNRYRRTIPSINSIKSICYFKRDMSGICLILRAETTTPRREKWPWPKQKRKAKISR